jgi:Recombination endonuclease VII
MAKAQDYKCAICGEEKRLVVDHDHATGDIRALLCDDCNKGLGSFKDNPDNLLKAAYYLEKHSARALSIARS